MSTSMAQFNRLAAEKTRQLEERGHLIRLRADFAIAVNELMRDFHVSTPHRTTFIAAVVTAANKILVENR